MDNIDTLRKFVGLVTDGYAKPRLARIVRVKGARADVHIVRNDGSIDDDYPEIPNCPLPSRLTDNSGYFGAPVKGALCLVVFSSGDISRPYIVAVYTDISTDGVLLRNGDNELHLSEDSITIKSGDNEVAIADKSVTIQTPLATIGLSDSGITLSALSLILEGEILINGNVSCSGTIHATNIP